MINYRDNIKISKIHCMENITDKILFYYVEGSLISKLSTYLWSYNLNGELLKVEDKLYIEINDIR